MDFGLVHPNEIKNIDFTLPPDGEQTKLTLSGLSPATKPEIRVGCSKWGRKEWINSLYPLKTKEANMLDEYSKHFNTLECNAVFYSIPRHDLIRKWKEKMDENALPGFLFLPKMSRNITHIARLENVQAPLDLFLSAIKEFGPYLGPIFAQIGDNQGPKSFDTVKSFVQSLPKDQKFFMEFRHEEWFSDPVIRKELFSLLAEYNIGSIITDSSGRRDLVHMELTTPEAFIRFVGNGGDFVDSDRKRIDEWIIRLKSWLDKGLQKVYFITHRHHANSHLLAKYTIEQFNKHLGANIPEIVLQPGAEDETV